MNLKQEYLKRLENTRSKMARENIDLLLVTPGPNLRYLSGYKAKNLERLTCLAIDSHQNLKMIVPSLEKLSAEKAGVQELGIEIVTWNEDENPYEKLSEISTGKQISIDGSMNAAKVLNIQHQFDGSLFSNADELLSDLRSIKSAYEISQLELAGKYIDEVHSQIAEIFETGDTEKSLAKKIHNLIVEVGHDSVDFVIVASGINSASPHHEPTDKEIVSGDVLLIDIGGTTPGGYCSDCTRMYCVGKIDSEFKDKYEILRQAQESAISKVSTKITAAGLDSVSRTYLEKHNLGEYFIHRTGHGIGLETHEEPYIVSTNEKFLEDGQAFSIEPGFYIEKQFGARIEDIVVKNGEDTLICNKNTKDIVVI